MVYSGRSSFHTSSQIEPNLLLIDLLDLPARLLPALASITFFVVGVCEAFSPNGLRWRRAARQLALTRQPTPCAHASSSDQWGLSRSKIKGAGSSTKSRPAVTVFVFSRDPARREAKHSLSAHARGR